MKKISHRSRVRLTNVSILMAAAVMIALFQNCTPSSFGSLTTVGASAGSGNGDSYTGKLSYFVMNDPAEVCSQLSLSGQPFPTRQIFYENGAFALVRDHCQDISPQPLANNAIYFDSVSGTVTYQGQSYAYRSDLSDYNTVPLVCPAGHTVINNSPTNMYASPIDLSAAAWNVHPPIQGVLDGSLSALPRYNVQVTSTNSADWYNWVRVAQRPVVAPNTQYAVSFVVQSHSIDKALLDYDENNGTYAGAGINMTAGTATITSYGNMATAPSVAIQPYGQGYLVTMFVTSSGGGGNPPDTGIAPWRGVITDQSVQFGDSIYATAAGFRLLSSYCSP